MRQSTLGKKIYDILEALGLRIAVSRFFNRRTAKREERNPTERMIRSREFFSKPENIKRVEKVESWLEDEKSKDIYRRMIKFRQTSRYADLPENHMRTQYFENGIFEYMGGKSLLIAEPMTVIV